jgi:hypothetical protein
VISMVRLATHTAPGHDPWLKQLLKRTPCLANLSKLGVLISGLLTPPIDRSRGLVVRYYEKYIGLLGQGYQRS